MNSYTLSCLQHGVTSQWKKNYNKWYYATHKEKWTDYLNKVKGLDYAKNKNKQQLEDAWNIYSNVDKAHVKEIQEYVKAFRNGKSIRDRKVNFNDEDTYKIVMKGLKKKQIKEMNNTRKAINKQFKDVYKTEIKDIYNAIKSVKSADLDKADKTILVEAGKTAIKTLAKGYVKNMLVTNLVGVGLIVERALNQEYH